MWATIIVKMYNRYLFNKYSYKNHLFWGIGMPDKYVYTNGWYKCLLEHIKKLGITYEIL